MAEDTVNVRYMVDDVDTAVEFYTRHFGFTLRSSAAPAFADIVRGNLRLLLSGPKSSAGRPMPDGRRPAPGGWNRIEFVVDDIGAEVERLRAAGLKFRNDVVTGPGGSQILLEDPSGNPIELFQPAAAQIRKPRDVLHAERGSLCFVSGVSKQRMDQAHQTERSDGGRLSLWLGVPSRRGEARPAGNTFHQA